MLHTLLPVNQLLYCCHKIRTNTSISDSVFVLCVSETKMSMKDVLMLKHVPSVPRHTVRTLWSPSWWLIVRWPSNGSNVVIRLGHQRRPCEIQFLFCAYPRRKMSMNHYDMLNMSQWSRQRIRTLKCLRQILSWIGNRLMLQTPLRVRLHHPQQLNGSNIITSLDNRDVNPRYSFCPGHMQDGKCAWMIITCSKCLHDSDIQKRTQRCPSWMLVIRWPPDSADPPCSWTAWWTPSQ